jgi:hypothetical protein
MVRNTASRCHLSPAQLIGILLAELPTPLAYRCIAQYDAASGHKFFHIAITKPESKVQPYSMADNLGGKAMALINTSYAVEGFGEAKPPRDLNFLVVFAGFAGKYHQKRRILGGRMPSKPPIRAPTA